MRLCLLLLCVACAGAPKGVRVVEDEAWREVLSPDVRLITDADADLAYGWFAVMDIGARLLAHRFQALVPGEATAKAPITVLLVADCARLAELGIGQWSGRTGDLRAEPLVVACGSSGDRPLTVAMHELAHVIQSRITGPLPAWIDEGLAQFHGATRVLPKQIITGFLLPDEQVALREARGHFRLARLRALDRKGFLAEPGAIPAARLFVQVLATGSEEERRRLTLYLRALAADASDAEAWAAAFDDLAEDAVDQRLAEATDEDLNFANLEPRSEGPPPAPDVRRLSDGEALLWWAQLLVAIGAPRATVDGQLEAAAKAGGSRAEIARLRAASTATPLPAPAKDADSLSAWLQLELARRAPDPLAGLDGHAVPGLEVLDPEAKELARQARTPSELATAGRYFALRALPNVALGFAVRALDLDRGCAPCRDTLALVLWQLGRKPEARRHQQRLLLAPGATDAMIRRAQAYR